MSAFLQNPQWAYVVAAYAVTLGGLLAVAALSYRAMRSAERRVERMKEKP